MKQIIKKILLFILYIAILIGAYVLLNKNETSSTHPVYLFYILQFIAISILYLYQNLLEESAKFLLTKKKTEIEEAVKTSFTEERTRIQETVKNEFNIALEEIKSNLEKNNIAYQVDYSFYYTERSKALIELFKKLQEVYNAGIGMSAFWKANQVRGEKMSDYQHLYLENMEIYKKALLEVGPAITNSMIFLEDVIIDSLNDFVGEIDQFTNKFMKYNASYDNAILENDFKEIRNLLPRLREFANYFTILMQPSKN